MHAKFLSAYRGVADYMVYPGGNAEPFRVHHYYWSADQYEDMYWENPGHWNYNNVKEFMNTYGAMAGGFWLYLDAPASDEAIEAIRRV